MRYVTPGVIWRACGQRDRGTRHYLKNQARAG
jgi:hypothetical protein